MGFPVSLLSVVKSGDTYKPSRPVDTSMYAFAVLGPDAERALDRLLPALEGRVGTIRVDGAAADGGTTALRADTEYALGDEWRAAGTGLSLDDALDRLAPDHEYAAVIGAQEPGLPSVEVGEGSGSQADEQLTAEETVDGQLIVAEAADDLDVAAAVTAIRGTEPHETLESLVAAVKSSPAAEYAGAIATFTGRVRAREDPDDERTQHLEFEKYDGVADDRMRTIESELADRDGVHEVRLHHRTGRVAAGEDIVFVVVLAGHRREAFRTVEDGIDRLKDEVPLFKKEVTGEESFWVHERED